MANGFQTNKIISIAEGKLFHESPSGPFRNRILLADASKARRHQLKETLSGLQAEFYEAVTTGDALTAVSMSRVDLVLIDLNLGEMGAIELCRLLKKTAVMKFLPIFVLSASNEMDSEVRAIEAGADGYFTRPLRPRIFQARVQASLRHKAMIDSLDDSEAVLFSLARSMEDRDPGLGQHCERLALMASAMGSALGLPNQDIVSLQRSGYLHDIGKVAVPDHILFKDGPLNSEEWEVMMAHPGRGERICSTMRSLQSVLPIIRHHHERWDGSGYPDKLKGEEIPLLARILQLADIYDALTTARPYKRAFSASEAIDIIRKEADKGWRDPKLVEQFSEILPMFRTTSSACDISQISLQALAHSLNRACQPPVRSIRDASDAINREAGEQFDSLNTGVSRAERERVE